MLAEQRCRPGDREAVGVRPGEGAGKGAAAVALTALTVLVLLRSPIHPLLLMAAGAVLGIAGIV